MKFKGKRTEMENIKQSEQYILHLPINTNQNNNCSLEQGWLQDSQINKKRELK